MINFVLLRHGETNWNHERRFQGSLDSPLTAKGKKRIKNFVKELKLYQPEHIFSSTLNRCKESANLIAKPLKKRLKMDKRLNELAFGEWEGRTADELIKAKDSAYCKWYKGQTVTPKGGESITSLEKRIGSFINHCRKNYDDQKILIVTHGGSIRMFLKILLQLNRKQMFYFRIDPGTMTVIGDYAKTRQLIQINSTHPKKGIIPHGCV